MKLRISILLLLLILISNISFGKDIIYSSKVIIDSSEQLNGQEIKYQGEAIGDILYRNNGENGWVNINDGSNAIGIWTNKEQLQKINVLGEYQAKGDIVLVTGIVNSACSEHGGDLDIHATEIEIIENGNQHIESTDEKMFTIYKLLIIPTVLLLMIVFFVNRNKEKKK